MERGDYLVEGGYSWYILASQASVWEVHGGSHCHGSVHDYTSFIAAAGDQGVICARDFKPQDYVNCVEAIDGHTPPTNKPRSTLKHRSTTQ